MADTKTSEGPLAHAASIGGALVGFFIARYCGVALVLPGAIALGVFFLAHKKLTGGQRIVLAPASIAIGHDGWMIFAAVYGANWAPVSTDVVVFSALAVWLFVRPAVVPLLALAAFQLLALYFNFVAIWKLEVGTTMHEALTAHILLRLACLAGVYFAVNALKARTAAPVASVAPLTPPRAPTTPARR